MTPSMVRASTEHSRSTEGGMADSRQEKVLSEPNPQVCAELDGKQREVVF
jgi:hypothetical protein